MNNKINLKKYRNLPITSFVTGILSLTTFSLKAFKVLFSSYLYTDIASKIFSTVFVSILGLALPIVAIVCGSIDLARIKKGLHKSGLLKLLILQD
jgi:ABC-type maltose transport system permease subunit